jgi:hypothetical protein
MSNNTTITETPLWKQGKNPDLEFANLSRKKLGQNMAIPDMTGKVSEHGLVGRIHIE